MGLYLLRLPPSNRNYFQVARADLSYPHKQEQECQTLAAPSNEPFPQNEFALPRLVSDNLLDQGEDEGDLLPQSDGQ